MSQDNQQENQQVDLSKQRVILEMAATGSVEVRRDFEYPPGGGRTMDLYSPPDHRPGEPRPAVVIVAGYPDPGYERFVGCKFKQMGWTVSWAELIAASGLVAVTYANREPAADLDHLLDHLRNEAGPLGIDADRLGLLASSGNGPLALSALLKPGREELQCAALCYPYTLDPVGGGEGAGEQAAGDQAAAGGVAKAAATFGFANPCAGKTAADLAPGTRLLIVRAGDDQTPGLNATLDPFVAEALACGLPLSLANHPSGSHAFDLLDDGPETRALIRQVLAFLQISLTG